MLPRNQWHDIMAHIRKLQPNCLIIANNSHVSKDTDIHSYEYPVLPKGKGYPPPDNTIPSEVCDTIVSNGKWFWHPGIDAHMRSAEDIVKVLNMCNERRANFLVNVQLDRNGLLPEAFVKRLKEIGEVRN